MELIQPGVVDTSDMIDGDTYWKDEQQKIANFLDYKTHQIDQLIEKKKALIEKLDEQRIAVITQAVTKGIDDNVKMKSSGVEWLGDIPLTWKPRKLRFIFGFGRGLGITKAELKDDGVPCVNYGEIHSRYGFEVIPERDALKYVDPVYLETDIHSLLESGDFVFADTSEDLDGSGNFTYLNSNHKTFAGYHTVVAKPKIQVNSRFLAFLFDAQIFRSQIRKSVSGVKVFSITQGILKDCIAWLPLIDEQQRIVEHLDRILNKSDRMKQLNLAAIDKLEEYRVSLITAAVTGKINVQKVDIPKGE